MSGRLWIFMVFASGYLVGTLRYEGRIMSQLYANVDLRENEGTTTIATVQNITRLRQQLEIENVKLRQENDQLKLKWETIAGSKSNDDSNRINNDDPPPPPPPPPPAESKKTIDLLPHLKDCDKPQSESSLTELAKQYKPTKFVGYLHNNFDRFYPQYMEKYRNKYFRMLEIGLDSGAGSLLWQQYFPCATLIGLDYAPSKGKTEGASQIQTIIGDQGNETFLQTTFLEQTNGGNFDLIVDDGGHHYEQQRASYEVLFETALSPGGLYIIEDVETSYWKKGEILYGHDITRGGKQEPQTIMNQFLEVVHVVNKKFHDNTFSVFGQVDQLISTIGFGSNVIFLEKKTRDHCWNERPYVWPKKLGGPARKQPVDANKGTLIDKFCRGIKIHKRDKKGRMRAG